jgi:hypothetical protein
MERNVIMNDTLRRTWQEGGSSICLEKIKNNSKLDINIREIAGSITRTETAIPTETLVFLLGSSCQMPGSTSHYATSFSFHAPNNYSLEKVKLSL